MMATKTRRKLSAVVGAAAAAILMVIVPQFEGTIFKGYRDPIGIVTACTGNTSDAVLGKRYSPAECASLLEKDLVGHAQGVMRCIRVPTSQKERAAYVSFAFNVGVGAFCHSTANRLLNAGKHREACNALMNWTRAGRPKRVLPGLVTRRKAERALCLEGVQ